MFVVKGHKSLFVLDVLACRGIYKRVFLSCLEMDDELARYTNKSDLQSLAFY